MFKGANKKKTLPWKIPVIRLLKLIRQKLYGPICLYEHKMFEKYVTYFAPNDVLPMARSFGFIATSSGLAQVCELIRFSTSESITLAQYLKKYGETEEVRKAIIVLKNILLEKRIHCKNYHSGNIAVECSLDNTTLTLKLIDGLGPKHFIIFPNKYRYIKRRLKRLFPHLENKNE